jgi:hypothetical protein
MPEELATIPQYKPAPLAQFFSSSPDQVIMTLRKLAMFETSCSYELGCYLYRVLKDGLWHRPEFSRNGEYATYGNWVFGELGFSSRKGRYLASIAKRIDELSVPLGLVEELMTVGWAKAYQFLRAPVLPELRRWLSVAKDKSETELMLFIKGELAEDKASDPPVRLNATFSKDNYEMLSSTVAVMEKKFGVKKMEDVIACLCAHYLSTSLPGTGEEIPTQLDSILQQLEKQYHVRLMVVVPKEAGETTEDVS